MRVRVRVRVGVRVGVGLRSRSRSRLGLGCPADLVLLQEGHETGADEEHLDELRTWAG